MGSTSLAAAPCDAAGKSSADVGSVRAVAVVIGLFCDNIAGEEEGRTGGSLEGVEAAAPTMLQLNEKDWKGKQ